MNEKFPPSLWVLSAFGLIKGRERGGKGRERMQSPVCVARWLCGCVAGGVTTCTGPGPLCPWIRPPLPPSGGRSQRPDSSGSMSPALMSLGLACGRPRWVAGGQKEVRSQGVSPHLWAVDGPRAVAVSPLWRQHPRQAGFFGVTPGLSLRNITPSLCPPRPTLGLGAVAS